MTTTTATTGQTRRRTDAVRAARQEARDDLWREGDLSWLLDYGRPAGPQRDFYEKSKACARKTFISEDARRLGKSVALVVIAFELALKNPGSRINWCQDTSKGVRSSAIKTMEKLCRTAPPDCRGRFNTLKSSFEFPNGAYIFVFGGNTQEDADTARGGDDPIASFFDEAGFMRFLKYIYKSIVKHGMRLVRRNGHFGMIFISSSTPEEPDHFFVQLANLAEIHGNYIRRTIYASLDAERYIAEEAEEAGMTVEQYKQTDDFRRELMCERVINEERVVFPEFHRKKDVIVREWVRPIGFEQYISKRVSIDQGGSFDKWGILWGYVDFIAAKIVIEDECIMARPNTAQVAKVLVDRENALWPESNPIRITRVADDPTERLIVDLHALHRIGVSKAVKHDRQASINLARAHMGSEKLVIHPRCIELRKQLLTARSNKQLTDYERTEEGHFDLCASLQYFVRDLSLGVNPYPEDYDVINGRKLPAHHPSVARAAALGRPMGSNALSALLLGGNRYVSGALAKRRR